MNLKGESVVEEALAFSLLVMSSSLVPGKLLTLPVFQVIFPPGEDMERKSCGERGISELTPVWDSWHPRRWCYWTWRIRQYQSSGRRQSWSLQRAMANISVETSVKDREEEEILKHGRRFAMLRASPSFTFGGFKHNWGQCIQHGLYFANSVGRGKEGREETKSSSEKWQNDMWNYPQDFYP